MTARPFATLGRIAPPHCHLLVVEDDPQQVDLTRQLLEEQPYTVEIAGDGQVALAAIAQRQPDVILLALRMPRLEGFGVLESLRSIPRYRDMPVLVLTAKTCTAEEQALLPTRVCTVIQQQGGERDHLLQEICAALPAYRMVTKGKA